VRVIQKLTSQETTLDIASPYQSIRNIPDRRFHVFRAAVQGRGCVKTSRQINFEYFLGSLDPFRDGDRRTRSILEGRFLALRNSDAFYTASVGNGPLFISLR